MNSRRAPSAGGFRAMNNERVVARGSRGGAHGQRETRDERRETARPVLVHLGQTQAAIGPAIAAGFDTREGRERERKRDGCSLTRPSFFATIRRGIYLFSWERQIDGGDYGTLRAAAAAAGRNAIRAIVCTCTYDAGIIAAIILARERLLADGRYLAAQLITLVGLRDE